MLQVGLVKKPCKVCGIASMQCDSTQQHTLPLSILPCQLASGYNENEFNLCMLLIYSILLKYEKLA